jgi:PAS domain S-box-containing protein
MLFSRRRGGPHPTSRAGLRTAAVVLTATALPILGLLWASGVARVEVEHRALAGLSATAKATVLQEQQAWDDAIRVVTSAASRPVSLSAVQARDLSLAEQAAKNVLITGPFAAVRIYGATGDLIATATLDGVVPSPIGAIADGPLTVGDPTPAGSRIVRQVAVPFNNGLAGRLVVDVDMTQLLGKPSDLGFGGTGVKFLVTPTGLIVAGSTAVGTRLQSDVNRAIAAANQPVTKRLFSPFFGRDSVESYEPIPGQGLGILVQQSRDEIMGGADRLAGRLRLVAMAVGLVGASLAVSLGVVLSRRGRRLASSEQQFAGLLESAPDAIVVVGDDGRIRLVNRQTEVLFGYDRSELVGQPVERLIPERLASLHPHQRAGFFANPSVRTMGASLELAARRKDGSEFPVDISRACWCRPPSGTSPSGSGPTPPSSSGRRSWPRPGTRPWRRPV